MSKKYPIGISEYKKEFLSNIPHLDYQTARRLKGPIYDVLIQELNEKGCQTSAKYFRCLSNKEERYFRQGTIRFRVEHDRELLNQIFEYCVGAERAYDFRGCGGLTASFFILYKLLRLLDDQGKKLQWLLQIAFKIVMKIVRHADPTIPQPREIVARLYYMYGMHTSSFQDIKCMNYLEKALELCRGEKWPNEFNEEGYKEVAKSCSDVDANTDTNANADTNADANTDTNADGDNDSSSDSDQDEKITTLHELVVHSLAGIKIRFSKSFARYFEYMDIATEMARETVLLVAEAGINANKAEFFNAYLTHVEYLTEASKFHDAMKLLSKWNKYFQPGDIKKHGRFNCRQLMILGSCYAGLKQIKRAKTIIYQAVHIARRYNYRDLEANALLRLAMLYSYKKAEYNRGKVLFDSARNIYLELNDRENETKTHYLLAKLRVDEMFPFYMDIIKLTQTSQCNLYKLRRWKNLCEPFWIDFSIFLQEAAEDPLACLLHVKSDTIIDPDRKQQSFSRHSALSKAIEERQSKPKIATTGDVKRRLSRPFKSILNVKYF